MIEGSCHCGLVHWAFNGLPESATACNCSVCRRYGTLWAYDFEGERIRVSGETRTYVREDSGEIGFHFCPHCGCVAYWRGLKPWDDGRMRIAVNLRLSVSPDQISAILIEHFDGNETFSDLGQDGRCVKDMWF